MRILIAVASRHGSTLEIAQALATELRAAQHTAEVSEIAEKPLVDAYDAVLVGSAVYMGKWLVEARQFLEGKQGELRRRPVWLFSSGPVGDSSRAALDTAELDKLMALSGARGHQTFVGKLDPATLSWFEKTVVKVVKAPTGDFRDWAAVRAWADLIAREVRGPIEVGMD